MKNFDSAQLNEISRYKKISGIVVGTLILILLSASHVYSQTGLTLEDDFNEAERLFFDSEYEKSAALFEAISERLCLNERWSELCVEEIVYRSTMKRYDREFETSEELLNSSLEIAKEKLGEGHPLVLDVYIHFILLNESKDEIEKANEWINIAQNHADSFNITGLYRAKLLNAVGLVEDFQGNYQTAIVNYSQAFDELDHEEIGSDERLRALSQFHNNIGVSYRRLGRYDEAMENYQKGLEAAKQVFGEEHHEIAIFYNSIGTIYYNRGDMGTAADYFLRSARILALNYGEINSRVAIAFNNAGSSFFNLGDLESATTYLEKAQRIKEEIYGAEHPETAVGYNNLASIYVEKGEFERAEDNFILSIEVRKNMYGDDHPDLIAPSLRLSQLYIQLEKYDEGRDYLYDTLDIGIQRLGESHPDVIDIYNALAESYVKTGNLELANEYFDKELKIILNQDDRLELADIDLNRVLYPVKFIRALTDKALLTQSYYDNDPNESYLKDALELYELASNAIDLLQTSYQSEASKLNLIENNYEIYANAIDTSYKMYRISNDEKWLKEILYYSEKSRSRIALELLQNVEARNFGGVPSEVLDQEKTLNEKVTRFYQELHKEEEKGFETDSGIIQNYNDSLFYAKRDLDNFTQVLEQEYPSYFTLKYERNIADLEQIKELLKQDESLLNYAFGSNNLYALIIDKENISIEDLGSKDGLTQMIDEFRSSVTGGRTDVYKENGFRLYSLLIEPLKEKIQTESIIILPDQSLHYLPFEMLITQQNENSDYHQLDYLIRDYTIQYAPSATMLTIMNKQRPEEPRNLLALAPFNETGVVYNQDTEVDRHLAELSPLPLTQFETREIAKLFRDNKTIRDFFLPERTEVLTDRRATKNRVMNGIMQDYGFVHFATHAFVNESDPSLSGIALHAGSEEDGIVYVGDIYNLQMSADLVVLGACETGLGAIKKGEGLIGFTRAFIYAGTSNLVVSLWKVNDQPTAHLMINFYSYIREGQSYGQALRNAKLDLIDHPEMAAPRNWAAFILNGR